MQSQRASRPAASSQPDAVGDESTARTQSQPTQQTQRANRLPHYQQPTTSTVLPEYANAEAETIRASFTTGNYRLIAHLPNELKAHHVSEATASRIDDNITSAHFVAPHNSVRRIGAKGQDALFSTFDYKPEQYSRAAEIQTQERQRQEERRLQVNPLPFLYSTPRPQPIAALAGAAPAAPPGADPFDDSSHAAVRAAYLSSQGLLHGPFVPSTGHKTLGGDNRVYRLKLPELLNKLMAVLDDDWGDCQFQLYLDPDDLLMLQFVESSLDNPASLHSYMGMFVKSHPLVSEYQLAKLPEIWGHRTEEEGGGGAAHIYYALKPSHVKRRHEESFFAVHPEMAQAGATFKQAQQRAEIKEGQPQLQLTAGSSSARGSGTAQQQQSQPQQPHQQQQPYQQTLEERERMSALMASFDAGVQPLQPRRT